MNTGTSATRWRRWDVQKVHTDERTNHAYFDVNTNGNNFNRNFKRTHNLRRYRTLETRLIARYTQNSTVYVRDKRRKSLLKEQKDSVAFNCCIAASPQQHLLAWPCTQARVNWAASTRLCAMSSLKESTASAAADGKWKSRAMTCSGPKQLLRNLVRYSWWLSRT